MHQAALTQETETGFPEPGTGSGAVARVQPVPVTAGWLAAAPVAPLAAGPAASVAAATLSTASQTAPRRSPPGLNQFCPAGPAPSSSSARVPSSPQSARLLAAGPPLPARGDGEPSAASKACGTFRTPVTGERMTENHARLPSRSTAHLPC